jgi:hypothetical protein
LLVCFGWTACSNIFGVGIYPPSDANHETAPPLAAEPTLRAADVGILPSGDDRTAAPAVAGQTFEDRFPKELAALAFNDRFSASAPQSVASSAQAALPKDRKISAADAAGIQDEPPAQMLAAVSTSLPSPRPVGARRAQKISGPGPVERSSTAATVMAEEPTIFEKLFGMTKSSPLLAYASADPGVGLEGHSSLAGPQPYDRSTAVYDISARTVYLPNGTRLEAHSGLGDKLDDPRFAHLRMRGVTPPHVYDLTMRESLFHGVEALRLTPVGGKDAIHGRTGLLAHTYMLGPRGDSNGCVSFKDYNAFLKAYRNGEIKRLAVVARLN